LRVPVAALALEAFDFAASSSYWLPFAAGTSAVFLVDLPKHFCLIDRDGFAAFY